VGRQAPATVGRPATHALRGARCLCYGRQVGKSYKLSWGQEDIEPEERQLSGRDKLWLALVAVLLGAIFHQTVLKWLLP
jgi:hypothetical protein